MVFPESAKENGVSIDEPDFSDPSGFEDNLDSDDEYQMALSKKPVDELEKCCVIVDRLPIVTEDKLAKLKTVMGKILSKLSDAYSDFYPIDEAGNTKGFCFIEYPNKEMAENAKAMLDGYQLDRNYRFSANLFSDMRQYSEPLGEWKEPQPRPYKDVGDLWWWLQSPKCYDQFAVHYDLMTNRDSHATAVVQVFVNQLGTEPQSIFDRSSFTESVIGWSSYGSYMLNVLKQGVALWGGMKFEQIQRFPHEGVVQFEFSPKETFLVTYSMPEKRWHESAECVRIWHVTTGELKRAFTPFIQGHGRMGPLFSWSADESYVACIKPGGDGISVYETTTFTLIGKKHVKIDRLREFKWCPDAQPLIAYSCEEQESAPAEVGIMRIPEQTLERAHRIFSMASAELYWQKSGDRLAAHTQRYSKKKTEHGETKLTGLSSHLEIFELFGKVVSLQSMPLDEPFVSFAWEPNGDKFCVLMGSSKITPMICRMDSTRHKPQVLARLEASVGLNSILWAPAGGWMVVFAARHSSGSIFFVDTNATEPTRMNTAEHPGFNLGLWDPTGRFFVTCSTVTSKQSQDTGYRLYTFQGREMVRKNLDRLQQFLWRPRPPVKLSDDKIRAIKKNMKTISQKFEEEDKKERGVASQEVIEKRRKLVGAFKDWRDKARHSYDLLEQKRRELRRGAVDVSSREEDLVEETITVPLNTEKVKVQEIVQDGDEE